MTDHEKTDEDTGIGSMAYQKNNPHPDTAFFDRLRTIYDRQQFSWFVTDGKGTTIFENLDELTAREYSMKDDSYSIGWLDTDAGGGGFTSEPKVNADGIPITYANKDVLSEEDLE